VLLGPCMSRKPRVESRRTEDQQGDMSVAVFVEALIRPGITMPLSCRIEAAASGRPNASYSADNIHMSGPSSFAGAL